MWGLFRHYWVLVKLLITIPSDRATTLSVYKPPGRTRWAA